MFQPLLGVSVTGKESGSDTAAEVSLLLSHPFLQVNTHEVTE